MADAVVHERLEALQNYLQRLVNGSTKLLFSKPVLTFLRVLEHDVVAVSAKLAHHLQQHARVIHAQRRVFFMTPNQCWCAARRRLLPLYATVPKSRMTAPEASYGNVEDLPALYDFLQHVKCVAVRPQYGLEALDDGMAVLGIARGTRENGKEKTK